MYIKSLTVRNLKLIEELELSFTNEDGSPRMWTLLLGENGLCKTTLLQAIALSASGRDRANQLLALAANWTGNNDFARSLKTVGDDEDWSHIDYVFTEIRNFNDKLDFLPDWSREPRGSWSVFKGNLSFNDFLDTSWTWDVLDDAEMTRYVDNIYQFTLESFKKAEPIKNYSDLTIDERAPNVTWLFNEHYSPLAHARDNNVPGMLTIGYGTSRFIPAAGTMPRPGEPHRERLESLFGKKDIQGTDFVGHIAVAKGKKRAAAYVKALQKALFTADAALLPHIGRFGASSPETLIHSPTFEFKVGTRKLKVPATWLSQGYQSTISWIADLLGWAFWERDDITEPEEVEGLVLIDELDLHIHPRWQTSLVGALRKIFPKVQFIATTHSPMLLSSMYPEEVIVLEADAKGRVVARQGGVDPRLMTAGELFEKFFGVDTIQPPQLARLVYEYRSIAGNPYRSDAQDARLPELRARLEAERVTPGIEPVARRPLPAAKERG